MSDTGQSRFEDENTRGLTLRELVLEIRAEVKSQNGRIERLETKVNRIMGGVSVVGVLAGGAVGWILGG